MILDAYLLCHLYLVCVYVQAVSFSLNRFIDFPSTKKVCLTDIFA